MIISHKYKFIFIKTYKTAGTSLEAYLSDCCGESDVVTDIYPPVPGHRPRNAGSFYNHMPAFEVRRMVGASAWDTYFKFCVERNPWDKALSFYWMERFRNGGQLNIDTFLERDQIGINWPLYTDETAARLIVDRILQYESLEDELARLFGELGVPWSGALGYRAKSEYRQDRRPYREVLTPHQAGIITKRFAKEIEQHGYQF